MRALEKLLYLGLLLFSDESLPSQDHLIGAAFWKGNAELQNHFGVVTHTERCPGEAVGCYAVYTTEPLNRIEHIVMIQHSGVYTDPELVAKIVLLQHAGQAIPQQTPRGLEYVTYAYVTWNGEPYNAGVSLMVLK